MEPEKGLWHCFGCGEGGDGITFLQKSLGLEFGEAADHWRSCGGQVKYSPDRVRVEASEKSVDRSEPDRRSGSTPAELTSEDLALFRRLQDIYAGALATDTGAREYLKKRGITDAETIRAFGLGFVSGKSLPQLSSAQRSRLQDLGILNSKGNESLYNCIVCPLYNREGQVVDFWGRRILESENPHRSLPRNSHSTQAAIHFQAARGSEELVLVEGFLDALACYQAGIRNVLPVGSALPKSEMVKLLYREGVRRVVLALDPDTAGDEGAMRWSEELEKRGIGSVRVRLDFDPCDYFLQGGTATGFRASINRGEPLGREADDSEYLLDSHNLLYRVRSCGPSGRANGEKLKAKILVTAGEQAHRDVINLYTHKTRKTFANACCSRLRDFVPNLTPSDIEADLETIIEGLEERRRLKDETESSDEPVILSPEEQEEALKYLSEPGLVSRLQDDMEALGYVGEEEAKLLVYLIATSRKLPRPLSGIIGSGSGAGKSFLAELAEQLTPPEEVVLFSKLSPQALYYLPEDYLRGKLLVLEERAGGEGADYAIRTLQSKDCLTQIVTLKDLETGQMAAKRFTVRGPIAYLETTTQSYLNQENTSRCFEIPLDESAAQTRKIHEHQRRARSLAGLRRVISKDIIKTRHHNAQRLLEPVRVVIPYAEKLTFPARYLRTRRDHERFLSLIEAVAFLHQFQRVLRTANHQGREVKYIEATVEDYAVAYKLALRVLWVSLDELSRWGRELIDHMRDHAQKTVEEARLTATPNPKVESKRPGPVLTDVHWTRRRLREVLGWPDKRLRACLDELVSLEYLQTLDGSKGKAFIYRLNPDFSHSPKALGLLTPEQLRRALEADEPST